MAQVTSQTVANGSGASVRSNMNNIFGALFSSSSGATAPTTTVAGQLWFDTGSTPAVLKRRDSANTGWDKVNPGITLTNKSSGYTAVEADRYSMIRCTSALTLAFDPAADLGADWSTIVKADGGIVTLDPDGSETINGNATETLEDGAAALVFSDGSNLHWIKIPNPGTQTMGLQVIGYAVITDATASFTVSVSDGFSSITRTGTGDYALTFTTTRGDTDYIVSGSTDAQVARGPAVEHKATTGFSIRQWQLFNETAIDAPFSIVVHEVT